MHKLKSTFAFMKKRNYLVLLTSGVIWMFPHSIADSFMSLYITEELGGTYFTIGLIFGGSMAISIISYILGGYIADYYGRYKIVAVGSFLTGSMVLVLAIAPDWRLFMLATWAQAFFNMFVPAQSAILADSILPEKRGMGFATFFTFFGIVSIPGPSIGGYLLQKHGLIALRWALFLTFIFEMICSTIKALFLKETLPEREAVTRKGLGKFSIEAFRETYYAIMWMPTSLVAIISLAILGNIAGFLTSPYMIFYALNQIGLTVYEWGLIGTIVTAVGTIIGIPSGWIVDKLGKRKIILSTVLSSTTLYIGFLYCRNFLQAMIVLIILTVCGMLSFPATLALQADLTPREKRGRIEAAFEILSRFAFPASLFSGIVYGISYSLPFYVSSALMFVSFMMALAMIKEPEKPEI